MFHKRILGLRELKLTYFVNYLMHCDFQSRISGESHYDLHGTCNSLKKITIKFQIKMFVRYDQNLINNFRNSCSSIPWSVYLSYLLRAGYKLKILLVVY